MEQEVKSDEKQTFSLPRLFTSCFGLGRLPVAPGTWGSIPAALLFGLLCHFHTPPVIVFIVMLAIAVDASTICIVFAQASVEATGKKDPPEVVTDELAGQALTFLAAPLLTGGSFTWIFVLVGFVAFRVFDVLKPWPCRRLERLPGGFGILADDLMAGIYAAIVLQIYIYYFGG